MTGLSWFPARDLALEGRAIRRSGWEKWLLYRFKLWLISETDPLTALEARRVATTTDFRDSEFLAKDWTDEPWKGGSYPPCTVPGPALALAANGSGGAGAWTLAADMCGGSGEGGGVPPVISPPDPPAPADEIEIAATMTAEAAELGGPFATPLSSPPSSYALRIDWSIPVDSVAKGDMAFWASSTGLDFATVTAPTFGGAIVGATGPIHQGVGPAPFHYNHWVFPFGTGYPRERDYEGPLATALVVLFAEDHVTILGRKELSLEIYAEEA